ncbi:MAG: TetR/AcrR family transcriptional regulator [Calditrichia bacterium]
MKRTKEAALITRKQIIERAVELFLQKGFSVTTLDEIAKRSDVTRGAIYWHFSDKLDILNELIDTQHEDLSQLLSDLFNSGTSTLEGIEGIIEEIVTHFFETKSFQDFIELTLFKIEYAQLVKLKTTKTELTEYFIRNFRHVIKEAQHTGHVLSDIDANDVAITITSMINGMYRLYFILPDQVQSKESAMRAFTSYLKLLTP